MKRTDTDRLNFIMERIDEVVGSDKILDRLGIETFWRSSDASTKSKAMRAAWREAIDNAMETT